MKHTSRSEKSPLYIGPGYGAVVYKRIPVDKPGGDLKPVVRFVPGSADVRVAELEPLMVTHMRSAAAKMMCHTMRHAVSLGRPGYELLRETQKKAKQMIRTILQTDTPLPLLKPANGQYSFVPEQSFCVIAPDHFGTVHTAQRGTKLDVYADFHSDLPLVRSEEMPGWAAQYRDLPREEFAALVGHMGRQTHDDILRTLQLLNQEVDGNTGA